MTPLPGNLGRDQWKPFKPKLLFGLPPPPPTPHLGPTPPFSDTLRGGNLFWVKERKEIYKQISINTGSVSTLATKLKNHILITRKSLKSKTPLPILNHIEIWSLIWDVMGTSKFLFMCLKTIICILCKYMIFKFGFASKSSLEIFFFLVQSWLRTN